MTQMKKKGGRARGYFPKVAEARQLLVDDAANLMKLYKQIAVEALAEKEFVTAEKAVAFLLSHMPEDEETGTLLGTDIDKNREPDQKGNGGPTIQIGLALGGMPTQAQQALPSVTHVPMPVLESGDDGEDA